MATGLASLLTKTQRNRIRDNFDELTEEKKCRDQQRIRERVKSGFFDFHLLADYPDQQFELMFDDTSDDELRAALADTTLVVERLRGLHGIDQAELIDEARTRAETSSDATDTKTLELIELHTTAEVRRKTEDEIKERLAAGLWDMRADRLAKLGGSAFLLLALIAAFSWSVSGIYHPSRTILLPEFVRIWLLLLYLLYACLLGWLLIQAAQVLKHNIIPTLVKLIKNPREIAQDIIIKMIKQPGKTIRKSWDEL